MTLDEYTKAYNIANDKRTNRTDMKQLWESMLHDLEYVGTREDFYIVNTSPSEIYSSKTSVEESKDTFCPIMVREVLFPVK